MTKKYLSLEEAAEYCLMPVSSLRKKIKLRLLTAYKPGKQVVVDQKDLDTFILKSRK